MSKKEGRGAIVCGVESRTGGKNVAGTEDDTNQLDEITIARAIDVAHPCTSEQSAIVQERQTVGKKVHVGETKERLRSRNPARHFSHCELIDFYDLILL